MVRSDDGGTRGGNLNVHSFFVHGTRSLDVLENFQLGNAVSSIGPSWTAPHHSAGARHYIKDCTLEGSSGSKAISA